MLPLRRARSVLDACRTRYQWRITEHEVEVWNVPLTGRCSARHLLKAPGWACMESALSEAAVVPKIDAGHRTS
jgi:hypothetical protein